MRSIFSPWGAAEHLTLATLALTHIRFISQRSLALGMSEMKFSLLNDNKHGRVFKFRHSSSSDQEAIPLEGGIESLAMQHGNTQSVPCCSSQPS